MAINNVPGVSADINAILSRIREMSTKSPALASHTQQVGPAKFDQVLSMVKDSVGTVNDLQLKSENIKNDYLLGSNNVSLSQVIVSSEKSKLAFEGLVAVRNKILDAYKEIMNMPV